MARSFAEKLDQLFATIRRPDGTQWTLADVVGAVNERGQTKLSASYLSELRSGRKAQPNIWVANALAQFFGQPLEYFVEDDMEPVAQTRRPATADRTDSDPSFSTRLATLLSIVEPNGVADPTDDQLTRWLAQSGHAVDAQQLAAARAGTIAAPAAVLVASLAHFLGVPAAYLTDAEVAEAMTPQIQLMKIMKNPEVRRVAMRANNLDPIDLGRVADLAKRLSSADLDETDLNF